VGDKELLPHVEKICETLGNLETIISSRSLGNAAKSLDAMVNRIQDSFPNPRVADAFKCVHVMVTFLVSFRAEFEYHLLDTAFVAKRL
jgi:hypothetical protein